MRLTAYISLLVAAAMAADAQQTLTIKDYTGRGFAPDVVNYAIRIKPSDASKLRLTDLAGEPVACQVTGPDKAGQATLSFVTALPVTSTVSIAVSLDGQGPLGASSLKTQTEGETLVVANALMAVKVPRPGAKEFKKPVAADTLPAPVLAFRSGAAGAWLGQGRILSGRPVKAWKVEQTANGPVFAEIRYEIEYDGGGYYRAAVRVADRVPMATIAEEYDLGRMAETNEFWELDLTQGWAPDTVETARCWGNGGVDTGTTVPLSGYKVEAIVSPGALGNTCSLLGLFKAAETNAGATLVGVTPLRKGVWRRSADLPLVYPAPGQVAVRFPMVRTPPRWVETSPYSVVTHEPGLPVTCARRQWGLVLGRPPLTIRGGAGCEANVGPVYQSRLTYGVIGLDRYKDFVLDWPDAKPSYPRALMRASELPDYRRSLDGGLGKALTNAWSVLAGGGGANADNARRSAQSLVWAAICLPAQSHHSCSDVERLVQVSDDALARVDLPADARADLRAKLALLAYVYTDPDVTGQGDGAHTGNPNMSMARQIWIDGVIALLPDHPVYNAWLKYMAEFTEFKLAENMAPGGGWFEPGTYHMWAYQRMMCGLFGMESMKAPNLDCLMAYHRADSDYYMNLLTPFDSRYGARMISGFGNSATHYSAELLEMAGLLAHAAPEQAANLTWAWQANGRQAPSLGTVKPWVQPKEPALASRFFPGFGVMFRAHQGPDETFLLLRSGYLWSHWTVDQGNVALYSKGAALLPAQSYTYFSSQYRDFSQYNDIRFGSPDNEFRYGWPDSNVIDYGFGKRAQYAWASAGYPAWYITPGIAPGYGTGPKLKEGLVQKEGEFRWNRQIAFMVGKKPRSPNYFAFHDTIEGAGHLAQWFNLAIIGQKANVQAQGNRVAIRTEWPTSLDVKFADARTRQPELQEENQTVNFQYNIYGPTYAAATGDQPVSPNWFRADGKPVDKAKLQVPDLERRVLIRIPSEPGADHFWVAYPRGEGEAAPAVERLATNVVKVTHAEGTDYILLSPAYDRFEAQDIVLEGRAAAVRLAPDGATVCLLADAGRAGYRGQVFEGLGPFERTVALPSVKAGTETIKPDKAASMACRPQLQNHQDIVPGVKKAVDGDTIEYVVDSVTPATVTDGDVRIEARKALLRIAPDGVRMAVADASYALLVAGARGVHGVGPFDLTLTATNLAGTVDGKQRTLVASRPPRIWRPMYHMDGVRWYAGFPDDPAPWRDRTDVQFGLAMGVTDGRHNVEIREWESPSLPPPLARRAVSHSR